MFRIPIEFVSTCTDYIIHARYKHIQLLSIEKYYCEQTNNYIYLFIL